MPFPLDPAAPIDQGAPRSGRHTPLGCALLSLGIEHADIGSAGGATLFSMAASLGSYEVTVEPLSAGDIVAIASCIALDADAFPYASAAFGLRDDSARAWIARDVRDSASSGILGFVAAHVRQTTLHIEGLAVARRARRVGIARSLVREAVAAARVERMRAVALHVSVANPAAIGLYRGEGFAVRARLCGFYPPATYDGEADAYQMELRLRAPPSR